MLATEEGGVEWMPRFSEVLSLLLHLRLQVSSVPDDKPEGRRLFFAKLNARRHKRRRS